MVRVSILNAAPALLFEMPPADPVRMAAVRARRQDRRHLREMAQARRLLLREQPSQQTNLPLPVQMPRTVADCRGPGICPVLRCRYHLALWVKDNGSIKVGRAHEAGRTLKVGHRATESRLEHAADLVVELADRLESLCVLDYAEQARGQNADETYTAIAQVLGCGKQRARVLVLEALAEYEHARDIEESRSRRAQMRAVQQRPPLSPLVQIRPRPRSPMLNPSPRELAKVGE